MITGMYNAKLALITVGYSIQVKWLIMLFHFVFHLQPGHKYYCHPLWRFVLATRARTEGGRFLEGTIPRDVAPI